jgi:hypothetical protein
VPTEEDISGEGLVDFANDRIWLDYRRITPIQARNLRENGGVLRSLFARWASRRRETFFEADTYAKRKRRGGWGEPMPIGPWKVLNPLWLLGPLGRLRTRAELQGQELIRDAPTRRYAASLTRAEMPASAWEWIADPGAPNPPPKGGWRERHGPSPEVRDEVTAVVWLDEQGRIRRMAFEESRMRDYPGDPEPASDWAITELWDFAVEVDRSRPPLPSESDLASHFRERHREEEEQAQKRAEARQ